MTSGKNENVLEIILTKFNAEFSFPRATRVVEREYIKYPESALSYIECNLECPFPLLEPELFGEMRESYVIHILGVIPWDNCCVNGDY